METAQAIDAEHQGEGDQDPQLGLQGAPGSDRDGIKAHVHQ
jgi:hypothetical protein